MMYRKVPFTLFMLLILLSSLLVPGAAAQGPVPPTPPEPAVETAHDFAPDAGLDAVAWRYEFSSSSGTYIEITGGVTVTTVCDDQSYNNHPIGFTFTYDGVDYTNFSIQCNGFIAMGGTVANSYAPLSTGATNHVISALGMDLQTNTADASIRYEVLGAAPDRILVVQYKNLRNYAATGDAYNFQFRLHETSNRVEIVYGEFTKNATARTPQVGLRGASNADFHNRMTDATHFWANSLRGAANNSTMALNTTTLPPTGLTYGWDLFTGVVLLPEAQSAGTCPGSEVFYDIEVINATGMTQTFDLDYDSVWPASGPAATGPIPHEGSEVIQVAVYIPWAANTGDSDVTTITAADPTNTYTATATATTVALLASGWQDYADVPTGRGARAPSVVYWDGKLYKIGGWGDVGGSNAARPWLDIYDIATDTWSQGADMPAGRYWIDCVAIDAKIYCGGGYLSSGQSTLYIYDIATDTWSTGAALPANRYNYAGVELGGKYYLIGGYTTAVQATMVVYDPVSDTWDSSLAPMNVARRYGHAGVIGGKIYVAGGYSTTYLSSVEAYDPATNTWTYVAPMPSNWVNGADGVKHDRYLVIAGGSATSTAGATNGAFVYDAQTDTWDWLPLFNHQVYGAEGDGDGNDFWVVSGRLYEGAWGYSPYTTKLVQCTACEPVYGADFTVTPTVPRPTVPATFEGSVAGGSPPITWDWDLGDGSYASGQTFQHAYAVAGTYTVVMTATNCDGVNWDVVSRDVLVEAGPMIVVDPLALASTQCPDSQMTYTLSICNEGDLPLDWTITEVPGTLLGSPLQVTIPAGPATAPAGTAVAAGPYSPRPETALDVTHRAGINAPPDVLLLAADDDHDSGSPIQALLQAYGDLGAVDLYDPRTQTPTLGDLLPYDVVVVWSNYDFADPTAIGNVLADYVDAGGKVIDLMFGIHPSWGYQGRFRTEGYTAFTITGYTFADQCLGAYDPNHPVMSVPDPITNVCEYYRGTGTALTAGSTAVANWSGGEIFVGVKDNETVVTLNGYVGYYYQWTGQMDDVLHNAILWLAGDIGGDIPWLDEDPTSGTVPAGECQDVLVTFNSDGMAPGAYTGTLRIDSNDNQDPVVNVPVTLTVAGPHSNVDFTWDPPVPEYNTTVTFYGTADSQVPVDYTWDFGDGNYGSGEEPTHTYALPGYYTVVMTATTCGLDITATHELTVVFCQSVREDFEGAFPPAGWTVINNGGNCVWKRNDDFPTARPNYAGGDGFAADADSDKCGSGTTMNTELWTPPLDLSQVDSADLSYVASYNWLSGNEFANTDISTDGGATWTNLVNWTQDHDPNGPGELVELDLTPYIGYSDVIVRFHYYADGWKWWFLVDQVDIGGCYVPGTDPSIGVTPATISAELFMGDTDIATLTVSNWGLSALDWTADVGCGTPVTWLDLDPGAGTVPPLEGMATTATFDTAGLLPDTYTTTICFDSNDPLQPQVIVTATLVVIAAPVIVVTPEALTAEQCPDTVTTQTLSICNTGYAPLTWSIWERPLSARVVSVGLPVEAVAIPQGPAGPAIAESGVASGRPVVGAPANPIRPADIGDAWETMAPLPAARVFNAVVAAGPYVYVIGGSSDAGGATPTATNYRYDTASDSWSTMTPMPAALGSIDGIAIGDLIYIPGSDPDSNTYVYDTLADTWSVIPANGGYAARVQYQVVAIGTDLYVLGGIIGGASTPNVWVLNTTTGAWAAGVPMQKSRTAFAAAAIDGDIYVAGGVAFPGFAPDMTAEMFDGTSWSYIAPVPDGGGAYTRWSYNADGMAPGALWLAAGRRDAGWNVLDHAGYYDVATNTWTDSPTIPVMNQGRVYVEGDVAADGYFYVIGGRDSAGSIAYDTNERLKVATLDVPWLSVDPTSGTVPPGECQDVTVTFDSADLDVGDYFAELIVDSNDPFTPRVVVPVTLTVAPPPEALAIDWWPLTPLMGQSVYFTGTAAGLEPLVLEWAFGDGNYGSGENPVHVYSEAGDYTVVMTVSNDCGYDVMSATITVVDSCVPPTDADFDWTPITPTVGEEVAFTGMAAGTEPMTYTWDLGDGTLAEGPNPVHTYDAEGVYTVIMTVTNECGEDWISYEITVLEEPCIPPYDVDFDWDPAMPLVDEEVTFTATAAGTAPITYEWDLGDGTVDTGEVVYHAYAEAGVYTVVLTATGPCGDPVVVSHEVTVYADCVPPTNAAFTWLPTTPAVGQVVTFNGSAAGTPPMAYDWDFGDGTLGSGAVVTHTYAATGTYDVWMMATNNCGYDAISHTLTVVAEPVCTPVEIVTVTTAIDGCSVAFAAQLTGDPPFTYLWAFGDGDTSALPGPTHTYAATGTYNVTLEVWNCDEGYDTVTFPVSVSCPPPRYYIYLPLVARP